MFRVIFFEILVLEIYKSLFGKWYFVIESIDCWISVDIFVHFDSFPKDLEEQIPSKSYSHLYEVVEYSECKTLENNICVRR